MMRMFQTYYDCRAVVFTTTPRIIEVCNSLGITTSSNMTLNPFGLPYIGSMYHAAASLFDGAFYGYINADILLSTSFMEVLSFIESQRSSHSRDTLIEVCHNAYNVRAPKLSAAMQPSDYDAATSSLLQTNKGQRGKSSVDLFILSSQFRRFPFEPMVIARSRIDTYMMYYALRNKGMLIDSGDAANSFHQGLETYTSRAKGVTGEDYNWNKERSKKYFVDLNSATGVVRRRKSGGLELGRAQRVVLRKKKA